MLILSERSKNPVSEIRLMFAKIPAVAKRRKAEGLPALIDLSIGRPHMPPNPVVMQHINQYVPSASSLSYTPAQGEPETLEAIVRLYTEYYPTIQYDTDEVMATVGGSGALSNAFSVVVEKPEDVILTFEPFFAAYTGQIKEWGGTIGIISTEENRFRPTAQGLRTALEANPKAKALILNYPNNPTGISLTEDEVKALVTVIEDYPDLLIIIDDVYRGLNYKKHMTILDLAPHLKERTVVINSGAKDLVGAPGLRVGMIAAPRELIKAMISRQTNGMSSVPYHTQAALRFSVDTFLKSPQNAWISGVRAEYRKNIDIATHAFAQEGFQLAADPEGAFYIYLDASPLLGKTSLDTGKIIKTDMDIAEHLLEVAGVAAVPASGFGSKASKGLLRISCANEGHLLQEAAKRIGIFARSLDRMKMPQISNLARARM